MQGCLVSIQVVGMVMLGGISCMNEKKNWVEILGIPQGNETVWANEIIRKVAQFQYKTLWVFDNHTSARNNFEIWQQESKYENKSRQ